MKKIGPEAAVLKSICDYLTARRILWFRMNSGSHIAEYKGRKRMIRYGTPGIADLLVFPRYDDGAARFHYTLFVECKAATGRQSEAQKVFEDTVRNHGLSYLVAYSVDEVENWLCARGI